MSRSALLFVKAPRAGSVKTRLLPRLGADGAARLYEAFVLDALELLDACAATRRVVAYAPAGGEERIRALVRSRPLELVPQPEGDLGTRMEALLADALRGGADAAVILGSDCPTLPLSHLDDALALAAERDVVLGPSTDGGYYLVGGRRIPPGLFQGIEWSTPRVLGQTLERLGDHSLGLTPPWYDVDTPEDLDWLRAHLRALRLAGDARAGHTRRALASLVRD